MIVNLSVIHFLIEKPNMCFLWRIKIWRKKESPKLNFEKVIKMIADQMFLIERESHVSFQHPYRRMKRNRSNNISPVTIAFSSHTSSMNPIPIKGSDEQSSLHSVWFSQSCLFSYFICRHSRSQISIRL
jgi:hypothetical protein